MSDSNEETTKTVVVENDIHKAIRSYAGDTGRNIQDIVDDLLRGSDNETREAVDSRIE